MRLPLSIYFALLAGIAAGLASIAVGAAWGSGALQAGVVALFTSVVIGFGLEWSVAEKLRELIRHRGKKSSGWSPSEVFAVEHLINVIEKRHAWSSYLRRSMLISMREGFQLISSSGETIEVNPTLLSLLQLDRSSFMAASDPFFYLQEEGRERAHEFLELSRSEQLMARVGFEALVASKSTVASRNKTVKVRLEYVSLDDNGNYCITAYVCDELNQVVSDLSIAEVNKLKTLSAFAGGIAHNMNNLLMGITSSLSILEGRIKTPNEETKSRMLNIIRASAERVSALSHELLLMSKIENSRIPRGPINVNQVAQEVINLARSRRDSHSYNIDLKVSEPRILALSDDSGLNQVLLNLILNSMDAMPNGGKINIRISQIKTAEGVPNVAISVQDYGSGIDDSLKLRIFEPFFSTKTRASESRGGTGLGLSSVKSLVESWGGAIDLESEVGKGATFTVYLPAVSEPASQTEYSQSI